jgi:hypothetical protein
VNKDSACALRCGVSASGANTGVVAETVSGSTRGGGVISLAGVLGALLDPALLDYVVLGVTGGLWNNRPVDCAARFTNSCRMVSPS